MKLSWRRVARKIQFKYSGFRSHSIAAKAARRLARSYLSLDPAIIKSEAAATVLPRLVTDGRRISRYLWERCEYSLGVA
jgi:hypothetical protein